MPLYFLVAGYYEEAYVNSSMEQRLNYRFIVEPDTMNQLLNKHLLTHSNEEKVVESDLSSRDGIKRYVCSTLEDALHCAGVNHGDKSGAFHTAPSSIFLIEIEDTLSVPSGVGGYLTGRCLLPKDTKISLDMVRESYLCGYRNVGNRKYHMETLDKKAASIFANMNGWKFVVFLAFLPTLVIPAIFFCLALREKFKYQGILDQSSAFLTENNLAFKNSSNVWEYLGKTQQIDATTKNKLIRGSKADVFSPVLTQVERPSTQGLNPGETPANTSTSSKKPNL